MSELDKTYIGRQAKTMDTAPQFDGYSKVRLIVSEEMEYTAGTDTGLTLTLTNPFGTQQMCNDILAYIRGYAYQPASASGAEIDPAAEIGDGVTIGSTYTGIYIKKTQFGRLHTADVEAPTQKEIPHEYEYKSQSNREVNRRFANVSSLFKVQADQISAEVTAREADSNEIRATLAVQEGQIAAKVSKTGGNSSFGWNMTDTAQVWKANGSEVLRVDRNGAKVTGEIRATSGTIGGFTIGANELTYNNQRWGGTNSVGAYIGTSGLQLGSWGSGTHIDMYGNANIKNLYAENGYFRGYVSAGSIQYGGNSGYFNGSGLVSGSVTGSRIGYGTITGGNIGSSTISSQNTDSYINRALAHAEDSYNITHGYSMFDIVNTRSIMCSGDATFSNDHVYVGGQKCRMRTAYLKASDGSTKAIQYLGAL